VALASDVAVLHRLTGRIGISMHQGRDVDPTWTTSPAVGLVLHFAPVSISYAYSPGLGEADLMPRHHFGLVLLR